MKNLIFIFLLVPTPSCAKITPPPENIHNICKLFNEKSHWSLQSQHVFKKRGVPVYVQMAIMHQESRFVADASPPRNFLEFRPSTAYGYAQALGGTWNDYLKSCKKDAERDNFADACNFIGWYLNESHKKLGISKLDVYNLYLAYHEGNSGYQHKSYLKKKWLLKIVEQISKKSNQYRKQLTHCQK